MEPKGVHNGGLYTCIGFSGFPQRKSIFIFNVMKEN